MLTSFVQDDGVSPHFMSAVVLDQLRTPAGAMPARQVIDGPQRLTTLQVLLAAVRDSLVALGATDRYVRTLGKLSANDDDMSEPRTLPSRCGRPWSTATRRLAAHAHRVADGRRDADGASLRAKILVADRFVAADNARHVDELMRAGQLVPVPGVGQ